MLTIAFVFTAAILVLASIKLAGAILGNGVTLPAVIPYTELSPSHYVYMYPALFFQVWFWTDKLGLV